MFKYMRRQKRFDIVRNKGRKIETGRASDFPAPPKPSKSLFRIVYGHFCMVRIGYVPATFVLLKMALTGSEDSFQVILFSGANNLLVNRESAPLLRNQFLRFLPQQVLT